MLERPKQGPLKCLPLCLAALLAACSDPTPAQPPAGSGGATPNAGGAGGRATGGNGGGQNAGGQGGSNRDAGADQTAPCGASNLTCNPLAALPQELEATGLIAHITAGETKKAERVFAYTPSPELYSNGLGKKRFLLLPTGGSVNNQNRDVWEYPVGSIFVKTFYDERAGAARPVETRLIRRTDNRFEPFEYSVYRWSEDGRSATLLDIAGNKRTPVSVSVAGRSLNHTIPSRNDCGECHDKNAQAASTIIGFDEVRLNHPGKSGNTTTQLQDLARDGVFSAAIPATPRKITDPNPNLQRVKTFVFGNCAHCHHGQQGIVDFRPDVFVANTIGKPPESPGITAPDGWARVVAGAPDMSLVYLQARGGELPKGLRPMPQVGIDVRDLPVFTAELDALRTWIMSLPR
ncbi:MAG TPA: hypothetical protein VGF45_17610 [Polyangia bacterium]